MDAFYASVELRRRPELKGKPVVVCGSGPRAVVTTASYEARRAGRNPLGDAGRGRPPQAPGRGLPPPDFSAYRAASLEVMAILRRNVETVEVVGLDEAYLDLTGLFSPKATMRRIAAEISEETRLGCSVGISENRMLAKITSELGKPGGLVVLSRAEALERFGEELPRPGARDRAENRAAARAPWDPHPRRAAPPRTRGAPAALSAPGPEPGSPPLPLRGRDAAATVREAKSQSAETTFDVDVSDPAALEASLAELSRRALRAPA